MRGNMLALRGAAMPKRILAANWKMHKTLTESQEFVLKLTELLPGLVKPGAGDIQTIIFPSFIALHAVAVAARDLTTRVGAQDCYFEPAGAFTGEVALPQIKDAGGTAVIVGHSERRHVIGEDDDLIAAKLHAVLNAGMLAILCVGELEIEREEKHALEVVARQLAVALKDAGEIHERRLAVAYEPVWAIGTGRNATIEDVEEMAKFIRSQLVEIIGEAHGREVPILYGGSVKPGNMRGYISVHEISGALVGGASLEADSFAALYREMEEAEPVV
jgi:triosephosphate isomerase